MQVKLAMKRRFQMQMGEINTLMITTIAAMFQGMSRFDENFNHLILLISKPLVALIIGSVYFQMPKNTSGFFSLVISILTILLKSV